MKVKEVLEKALYEAVCLYTIDKHTDVEYHYVTKESMEELNEYFDREVEHLYPEQNSDEELILSIGMKETTDKEK